MVKNFFYLLFIFLLSCSSADKLTKLKKPLPTIQPDILYANALKNFKKGEYKMALDNLKEIEVNHSYDKIAPKSILMTSYIYYEINEYIYSLENLKKFKNLYPTNINISYAEFLIGMCMYEQINLSSKDQTPTLLALKQFNKVIDKYPKSKYAEEAQIKINLINQQLAGHQMYLARFYIKKEKWTAAILKLQVVIEKYPKTIFVEEALHRMVEINYRIGNLEIAKKYAAILGYNFNSSEWYKKTYKIVGDKNYSIIDQERKKSFKDRLLNIFSLSK